MNNPERVTVRGGEKSRTDRKQREIWTESYCFVSTLPNVTVTAAGEGLKEITFYCS